MPNFVSVIFDFINQAGLILGLFFVVILNNKRNKPQNRRANVILSILIVILSLSIVHSLLAGSNIGFFEASPYRLKEPFILLVGPFLFFYVMELTNKNMQYKKAADHCIPFILYYVIIIPVYFGKNPYSIFLNENSKIITQILWVFIIGQYSYYYFLIIRILDIHRSVIETEYSASDNLRLSWVSLFMKVFLGLLMVILLILPLLIHTDNSTHPDKMITLALSIAIFILGYKGLMQKEIFSVQIPENDDEKAKLGKQLDSVNNEQNITQNITNPDLIIQVKNYIAEKKPYLNEQLTLTLLAGELKIPRNQLSYIINNDLGESFYSLINKYRIEEVKMKISDPANNNYTILSLAYDAGFPSKSSFNSLFKKYTGLTPTKYRENLTEMTSK